MRKRESPRRAVKREKVLSRFNRLFLGIAGYTAKDLRGLGDLSQLTSEEMQELLRRKTMEALAVSLKRMGPRMRLLRERD